MITVVGGMSSSVTSPIGGVLLKTANYTAASGDTGKLISFNSSIPVTLTMPASAPASPWLIAVENTGAGLLTVNRNGLNIDGLPANLSLATNQGVWLFSNGAAYYTVRGMGGSSGGVGVSKYSVSWIAQTSVTVTHNLGTTDVLCQVYGGTATGWFGSLVGAFTDASGQVIQVLDIGNGPVSLTVPFGASQLQLGLNDTAWFDNFGSWTINVDGTNHTVLGTAMPWSITGGLNAAYSASIANDGTAPTVIAGLTVGQTVVVGYLSGTTSAGGPYSAIYDANGVIGVYGALPNPAGYGAGTGGPFLQVQPESLTVNDGNTLTLTFGVAFTGKAVVVG